MARLRRAAHRLVWLNPLAAHPDYEPLTRGMRAAIPHTDRLLAGNSLASLEQLAAIWRRYERRIAGAQTWIERGDRVALATVVAVKKSAPRPPGRQDGRQRARRDDRGGVRRLRRGRRDRDRRRRDAGRGAAAACTSGSPTRRRGMSGCRAAARSTSGSRSYEPGAFVDVARAGGRAAEVTLLEGEAPGAKVMFAEDGTQSGSLGDARARRRGRAGRPRTCSGPRPPSCAVRCSSTWSRPAPRLILFGAVPIAAALCTLARAAGWRPYVVDPRTRFATRSGSPRPRR